MGDALRIEAHRDHPGVLALVRHALVAAGFTLRELGTGPDGEEVVVISQPWVRGDRCRVTWEGREWDGYFCSAAGDAAEVYIVGAAGVVAPTSVPLGAIRRGDP